MNHIINSNIYILLNNNNIRVFEEYARLIVREVFPTQKPLDQDYLRRRRKKKWINSHQSINSIIKNPDLIHLLNFIMHTIMQFNKYHIM